MSLSFGIDLGGTKIEIIALNEHGEELLRERTDTPGGDYQGILDAVAGLVKNAEDKLGEKGTVGMGTPGAISLATGLLKNCNSICLNGKPFKTDIENKLDREVRMTNDANCFALSEATDGAAAGAEIVFGVIIGTGCGGGVVVNGHVLTGPNAIAGEWGHNPLPSPNPDEIPGPKCYCGRYGCVESYLSGPSMANDYERVNGTPLSTREIVAQAEQGDTAALRTLDRYEERMARSLSYVINILDPNVIVLGGGMSNLTRLYDNVPKLWGRYIFSDRVDTLLVPPKFGDSSGVRGAAWLWNE